VTLSCTYTGAIPDVTSVKWYKEVNGVVSEIVTSPSTPSLTLTSVVMADAGHYTCSATNAVGERNSSSTVELRVNQGMLIMFANYKSIQACLIDKSIRLAGQVPLVDQELVTLPKHMCSPPVFNITRSLVLCVCFVDGCPFWSVKYTMSIRGNKAKVTYKVAGTQLHFTIKTKNHNTISSHQ
jgi:hypothetical protein